MKKIRCLLIAAGVLAACSLTAPAQTATNFLGLTNVVATVTITNYVTITNIVEAKPEAKPAEVEKIPKYPWSSSLTAGLTLTRGNSHSIQYYGGLETDKKTPRNEYSLGASGAYGSQDSKESVNTYGAFGQWNHLFTDKFYSYIRVEGRRDLVADVDYRFTIGPGAGYYLIKETNTTLSVEAGGGVQFQRIGDTYMVGTNTVHTYKDESFATIRFAQKFEHKFNDHARIWENVEFLPQVDQFDNYIVNAELGVETVLTKAISLKTFMVDNYASQPASGRLKNDFRLVSALSYKF